MRLAAPSSHKYIVFQLALSWSSHISQDWFKCSKSCEMCCNSASAVMELAPPTATPCLSLAVRLEFGDSYFRPSCLVLLAVRHSPSRGRSRSFRTSFISPSRHLFNFSLLRSLFFSHFLLLRAYHHAFRCRSVVCALRVSHRPRCGYFVV